MIKRLFWCFCNIRMVILTKNWIIYYFTCYKECTRSLRIHIYVLDIGLEVNKWVNDKLNDNVLIEYWKNYDTIA